MFHIKRKVWLKKKEAPIWEAIVTPYVSGDGGTEATNISKVEVRINKARKWKVQIGLSWSVFFT